MPRLSVPDEYRQGVREISELDEPTVEKIRGLLNTLTPEDPSGLPVSAISSLEEQTERKGKLRQVAEAIVALQSVRAAVDVSVDDFVDQVVESMESAGAEWQIPASQAAVFRKNISGLLSVESFALRSKVIDLRTDDERTFCSARILTDLRPVFGQRVEDGPKGLVVVHLLKLGFHHVSRDPHEEFYISLDAEDLETLKAVVERAILKAKMLKSAPINLPIFGVAEE